MISVHDLEVSLGGKNILKGVDLTLKKGESLVVLGCSGTGKSILLKSLLGLVPKQKGASLSTASILIRPRLTNAKWLYAQWECCSRIAPFLTV